MGPVCLCEGNGPSLVYTLVKSVGIDKAIQTTNYVVSYCAVIPPIPIQKIQIRWAKFTIQPLPAASKIGKGQFPSIPKKDRSTSTYKINIITKKCNLKEGEIEEEDVKSDPKEDNNNKEDSNDKESTNDNA